jgi:uncharacterized membrane protein YphA (DoxX/SURF4 family)
MMVLWLARIIRFALGGLFIWAALTKISDSVGFVEDLANYQLLPPELVTPAGYFLPWLELVCGLALVVGLAARGAALWICLQLAVFLVALGINLARGVDVDCGCFGPGGSGSTMEAFTRDLLLTPLAVGGLWAAFRHSKLKSSGKD